MAHKTYAPSSHCDNPMLAGKAEVFRMFEFHGWATIRVAEPDHAEFKPIGRGTEVDAIKRVRAAINEVHDEFSLFDIRQTSNNLIVMIAHGLRNHEFEPVVEL